ncbi:CocE/NonD family hydrolase [Mycobacterium hubeiense]|uniref:CocE/NonD family hydrolase n=1 Tax=Mycobacterium hubeiense TaxID=1867256 RepID=UPI000C7EB686|nr:CocE/NonD family hydrolase [Mycobacterium sp. QGD 101]
MGAARYVGRVGGLAIALGVGTAILTGQGIASADTPSDGSSSTGSSAASDDTGSTGSAATPDAGSTSPSDDEASSPGLGRVLGSRGLLGPKRAERLESLIDTVTGNAPSRPRQRGDKPPKANNVDATTVVRRQAEVEPVKEPAHEVIANARQRASAWLSSPRVQAGRAAETAQAQKAPERSTRLWTPPTVVATALTERPVTPTSAPAKASVTTTFANLVGNALNPFAGNVPGDAPVDSPASWMLLAAARREIGVDSTALLTPPSIAYQPTITLVQGVLTGDNTAAPVSSRGYPLVYTMVGAPSLGGKVRLDAETGDFTYLPYATVVQSGSEDFDVMVSEVTPLVAALSQVPLVGTFVQPVVIQLHQVPILGDALSPVIGYATVATVTVNPSEINTEDVPIAYTFKVESFDGTLVSTNFFPAIDDDYQPGEVYPTILNGPGLASPGDTNPNSPTLQLFRSNGYNVVTWDPRGEFDSGGVLQLNNPQFEGRDVSAIIDWVADQNAVQLDSALDPRMGMVGGSYGGGIQFVTAANDHRIDAIAPSIAWNSLNSSLYPSGAFKTSYAALLLLALVTSRADINSQLYGGIFTGGLLGILTPSQQALLASSGPGVTVTNITAPTLIIQGTVDVLFPLQEAITNAAILTADTPTHAPVPVKMIWFCGGHGNCLTPAGDPNLVANATLAWMDKWVKGEDVDTGPAFEWVDQNGVQHTSDTLPSDPAFYGDPIHTSHTGGLLPIIPLIGGSGPSPGVALPFSLGNGAPASNAINVPLTAPDSTTDVVGAPTVTMTYSGIGTSRHVYAQIVDNETGLVVGNIVTPIPVTLDGQEHTVTVPLSAIAYEMDENSDLSLQIVSSATPFLNFTQFGVINVSDVQVDLPTHAPAPVAGEPVSEPVGDVVSV